MIKFFLIFLMIVFSVNSETTLWTSTVTETYDFDNDATAEKDGSHDLTEGNTPTYNATGAKQGTHFADLDSGTDEYFTLADEDHFDIGASVDYSVAFWFKIEATYSPIAVKKDTTQSGWLIETDGANNNIKISHWSAWAVGSATSSNTLSLNTWYHVAIAYDYDATNEITMWISQTTFADIASAEAINLDKDPAGHAVAMYIGASSTTPTRDVHLDEFAWFNGHALSAADAEEIFDGTGSGGWREAGGGSPDRLREVIGGGIGIGIGGGFR